MSKYQNLNQNHPIVLFIDIDGVFHPYGCVAMENGAISSIRAFRWLKSFMETIEDFPDLTVVLHSSWRVVFNKDELRLMIPKELFDRLKETTNINIMSRFGSIEDYIKSNHINNYVIIDDEENAFPKGLKNLVVTNRMEGLSDPEICAQLWRALRDAYEKNNQGD